jgi:hypothetical protein
LRGSGFVAYRPNGGRSSIGGRLSYGVLPLSKVVAERHTSPFYRLCLGSRLPFVLYNPCPFGAFNLDQSSAQLATFSI